MASDGAGGSGDEQPVEDVRARFKAVLDRKNRRHQDMEDDAATDVTRSKAPGTHGPAGGKRTFRRKSG